MRRISGRRNAKQRWMIIGLLSTLFVFSTGYALLATRLSIRGTSNISANFNVYIASITEKEVYRATTNSTSVGADKLTANFDVGLELPGSYAEYTVVVKNDSNFNVELKEIQGIDEANQKAPKEIQYSVSGISLGEILKQGDTKEFTVKVVFDSSATSLPSTGKTLEIELNYEQTVDPATLPPTTETCFKTNATGETITDYLCEDTITDVVIPNTINGKRITTIGMTAFYAKGLTSVVIPDTIVTVGSYAFENNKLTSILIPDSVDLIETGAFQDNQLINITIGSKLHEIQESAFQYNQLTHVEIPGNVTVIGEFAFQGNNLKSVKFNDGLVEIGDNAFNSNIIESVVIPDTVIRIGGDAFSYNQLTKVTVGKNVTEIGTNAFWKHEDTNPNLTTIINKTGRVFAWGDITGAYDINEFVTGITENGVNVIAG